MCKNTVIYNKHLKGKCSALLHSKWRKQPFHHKCCITVSVDVICLINLTHIRLSTAARLQQIACLEKPKAALANPSSLCALITYSLTQPFPAICPSSFPSFLTSFQTFKALYRSVKNNSAHAAAGCRTSNQ